MENYQLQRIVEALATSQLDNGEEVSQFCAEHELSPSEITLEVQGIGNIAFPLHPNDIQKLLTISSKAKFGLREETLLNEKVRDTQEIPADALNVTIQQKALSTMLSTLQDKLGLDPKSELVPHLHNLLIYGPGQFFDMHQDSEKTENMIGTLVIVLPSAHIGGDLVILHGDDEYVFSSENINDGTAKCIAFYADCRHKVEKIKQGYRVALTYNLSLKNASLKIEDMCNPQLKNAVEAYFTTDNEGNSDSKKLVYFLDHSYSEHSLRWNMLKGTDRVHAGALRSVANSLDLLPYLALVEVHQSWSTDCYDEDPEVEELLFDEVNLSYWIDLNNKQLPFTECYVSDNEVCWTKETSCFKPFNSEYEGYTGNYGNTMDYWYRRAAIVLWPASKQIAMNFELNYKNAIEELLNLTTKQGNENTVKDIIVRAQQYLFGPNSYEQKPDLNDFARIALYIKDEGLASTMLSRFKWSALNTSTVQSLSELQKQYGIEWLMRLLHQLHNQEKQCPILSDMDSLISKFIECGGARQAAEFILKAQAKALVQDDGVQTMLNKPLAIKKQLPKRMQCVYELLIGCSAIKDTSILHAVIEYVLSKPLLYPELSLAKMLMDLEKVFKPEYFIHYKKLSDHLIHIIDQELKLGPRSKEDWSIITQLPCKCDHCKIAEQFLHSKTEITKIWPIVMAIREHIIDVFNGLGLPVDLTVEKKGSPHKLILTKNESLHTNAQKRFEELKVSRQKFN